MSTLYMIRHGQASFGAENYDKLSPTGLRQSQIIAEHFYKLNMQFDLLCTGSMTRHQETAHEFLSLYQQRSMPLPPVQQHEAFNEYDSRAIITELIPELLDEDPSLSDSVSTLLEDKQSFQRVFEKVMLKWVTDNYRSNKLMRWSDFTSRVYRGIEDIMNDHGRGKKIVIFTSGGAISATVKKALRLADEDTIRISWQIVNASITRFKCTKKIIMLASFNEMTHLELESVDCITYR